MFGKKKLFQENIEPRCVYCAKVAPLEEGRILCSKMGLVGGGRPLRTVPV